MSYISREAAIEPIDEATELINSALDSLELDGINRRKFEFLREAFAELKKDIDDIPAADAVEVIRCKDCAEFEHEREKYGWCYRYDSGEKPSDYCSHAIKRAERRET